MRLMRTWAATLFTILIGAGLAAAADNPSPSYVKDVKPFLKTYCMSCHSGARAKAGYSVESLDRLLKKGRRGALVVAEKPDDSHLLLSMTGKTRKAMPPRNKPQPKADEIDKIREWIKAGAKDDTPAEDKK
jgi:cytochrome c